MRRLSQGGFMTAWIVGQTTRFKAGVMGAGVSDWGMMIATSDIPTYEQYMGGGNPYEGAGHTRSTPRARRRSSQMRRHQS